MTPLYTMLLSAGQKLGPYEILALAGTGGMGEVYKARDSRLDRTVAIKVSAIEFSERFQREAHAIASLNHPHICTLYDVGPNYLVMEFIEGRSWEPVPPLVRCSSGLVMVLSATPHPETPASGRGIRPRKPELDER